MADKVQTPAEFVPQVAIAFGAEGEVAAPVSAASPLPVKDGTRAPLGYQQIVSLTLATAQALTVPAGALLARIQNNGSQPARYRDDGTDPTATLGLRIPAGETLEYRGNLSALRLIREADGTILDILYYA